MAKSHIFIAKSILKKYIENDDIIHYIKNDFKKIYTARPKSYNTKLGYYTNSNEEILNKHAEDKFIKLIDSITKKIKNNSKIELSEDNRITILKYLSYQILRNEYLYELLKEKHNLDLESSTMKNVLIALEDEKNIVWNAIKDCKIQLMINKSNYKFLLPITSTIVLNSNSVDEYVYILFVTPYIAFNIYSKNFNKEIVSPYYVDESMVNQINLKTLYILEKIQINDIIGLKKDLERTKKAFENKEKTII